MPEIDERQSPEQAPAATPKLQAESIFLRDTLAKPAPAEPPAAEQPKSEWSMSAGFVAASSFVAGALAHAPGRYGAIGKALLAGGAVFTAGDLIVNGADSDSQQRAIGFLGGGTGGFLTSKVGTSSFKTLDEARSSFSFLTKDAQAAVNVSESGFGTQFKTAGHGAEAISFSARPQINEPIRSISGAADNIAVAATEAKSVPGLTFKDTQMRTFTTGAPAETKFADYGDYTARGWRFPEASMNVFETQNGTRLLYPAGKADYARISLQETAKFLDELPDRQLIKELRVVDHAHPDQAWHRQVSGNPNLTMRAEYTPDGTVTLFRPAKGDDVLQSGLHEWSHLHKLKDPRASSMFDDASKFERLKSSTSSVETSGDEVFPILSESLLGKDDLLASAAAFDNPIKSAIWAKSMETRLISVPPAQQSTLHNFYLQRIGLVRNSAEQRAVEELSLNLRVGSTEVKQQSQRILDYIQSK